MNENLSVRVPTTYVYLVRISGFLGGSGGPACWPSLYSAKMSWLRGPSWPLAEPATPERVVARSASRARSSVAASPGAPATVMPRTIFSRRLPAEDEAAATAVVTSVARAICLVLNCGWARSGFAAMISSVLSMAVSR